MLKLKLQYFGHLMQKADSLEKTLMLGKIEGGRRRAQESSPTPQFKSISSSVLSFLHSPTLTSIHDHWKNHSLD